MKASHAPGVHNNDNSLYLLIVIVWFTMIVIVVTSFYNFFCNAVTIHDCSSADAK